jgi:hydroxypyruvate isomerase
MTAQLRFAVNCSLLFQELPLLQRPAAARKAGFDAVEFWWPFATPDPDERSVDEFVDSVSSAGAELIGLNFAAGDMAAGDRGLVSWPGREPESRASVEVAVSIAARLGPMAFNALYGNRIDGCEPAQQDDVAAANLGWAARAVAPVGGVVLVEPLSGAPRYPLRTGADVVAVLDRVTAESGAGNIRMLADLYHLAVNGDDVDAVIAASLPRIGHVQIADAPGRHEPGTGQLDLAGYLAALTAGGFAGYAALEYVPATTTTAGLATLDLGSLLAGPKRPAS